MLCLRLGMREGELDIGMGKIGERGGGWEANGWAVLSNETKV